MCPVDHPCYVFTSAVDDFLLKCCFTWCKRPCTYMAAACRLLLERAQELAACLAPLVRRECAALVQDMERFVLAPLAMSNPSERIPVCGACFCHPVCLSSRPVAGCCSFIGLSPPAGSTALSWRIFCAGICHARMHASAHRIAAALAIPGLTLG